MFVFLLVISIRYSDDLDSDASVIIRLAHALLFWSRKVYPHKMMHSSQRGPCLSLELAYKLHVVQITQYSVRVQIPKQCRTFTVEYILSLLHSRHIFLHCFLSLLFFSSFFQNKLLFPAAIHGSQQTYCLVSQKNCAMKYMHRLCYENINMPE